MVKKKKRYDFLPRLHTCQLGQVETIINKLKSIQSFELHIYSSLNEYWFIHIY